MRGTGTASAGVAAALVLGLVVSWTLSGAAVGAFVPTIARSPPAVLSPAGAPGADPVWDNGVVHLSFQSLVPSFTITSDLDPRVSASAMLTDVAELTATSNVTSLAPFQGPNVTWRFAAAVAPGSTIVWANATLPVMGGNGSWGQDEVRTLPEDNGGRAHVSLTFYLNSSAGSNPDSVRFTVDLSNWPWASSNDSLGVELVSSAVANTTLVAGASVNQLVEVRSGSSTPVSTLTWNPLATVQLKGGNFTTSTVGTNRDISAGGVNSTIQLQFDSVTGGYSGFSYDPTIVLNPSAFRSVLVPPWAWNESSIVIVILSGALVGILAAVARESRARPPVLPEIRAAPAPA